MKPETPPNPPPREKTKAGDCRLLVGTSGYSYVEWVEAGFYPPGTPTGRMLSLYAQAFPVTELNFTWYQMPREEAVERMRANAPPGFRFAAKLTRTLTHEVEESEWRGQAARFRAGMAPLVQARQLLAVLIQLPPDFERTVAKREYLAALLDELAGLPLAVEFRHASWNNDRVFAELARRGAALVAVDEPRLPGLFPALPVVTCPDLFYVRFHGRNARGWRSGSMQQKFDYDYTEAELSEWTEGTIAALASQAASGVLFFNNHVAAQAPKNARALVGLLQRAGWRVNPVPDYH